MNEQEEYQTYKNTYYRNNSVNVQNVNEEEKINQIDSLNKDKNVDNEKLINIDHVVELKLECQIYYIFFFIK